MKLKEFKVATISEFQELVNKKDFRISNIVVNSILNNLKTHKKQIKVFSVKCVEENTILDVNLEKREFIDTLKCNLVYFEDREMYEVCQQINEGIKILSESK
jgi:hypothetical protein